MTVVLVYHLHMSSKKTDKPKVKKADLLRRIEYLEKVLSFVMKKLPDTFPRQHSEEDAKRPITINME